MKTLIKFLLALALVTGLQAQTAVTGHAADAGGVAADAGGDVVGPASSTNNAFARWSGTTGKLLQDTPDLTYTSPTLSVPDAFNVSSAGSIKLSPLGTSNVLIPVQSATTSGYTAPFAGLTVIGTTGEFGILVDGYGSITQRGLVGRYAGGTQASPTAVASGNTLLGISARGYDGSTFSGTQGSINVQANETWAPASPGPATKGTRISFTGTPKGSTTTNTGVVMYDALSVLRVYTAGSTLDYSAWGTVGPLLNVGTSAAFRDTTSSGTVASAVVNSFAAPALTSTSVTTFTDAANVYIGGDPTRSGNLTITNSYGLWNAGKTRLDGAVQLPSTNTAGLQIYGTAIDATNYERLESLFSGGLFAIRTSRGGTGSSRNLQLSASTGSILLLRITGSTSGGIQGTVPDSSTAGTIGYAFGAGTNSATSGTNIGLSLTPTYNQASGTAANTDLLINRTETAVGSGAQRLIDAQVASASKFSVLNTGRVDTYNGIATAGNGVVSVQGAGRVTAQTSAAASVATYTVGASDASFEVSANVNVTTSTTHNFTVTCTYTDETNASRTLTMGFTQLSGATFLTAITNVTGAGPYESPSYHIRCKASTAITIATTGTFTTVTYNAEGVIRKLQ